MEKSYEYSFRYDDIVCVSTPSVGAILWEKLVLCSMMNLHKTENGLFEKNRLGVLWAGLEPTRGEYNMTYMAQVPS